MARMIDVGQIAQLLALAALPLAPLMGQAIPRCSPRTAIALYGGVDLQHGQIRTGTGAAFGGSAEYEPCLPGSIEIDLGADRFPGLDTYYHAAAALRQYFGTRTLRGFTRWGAGVSMVEGRGFALLHVGAGVQFRPVPPLMAEARYAYVTVLTSGIHPKYSSIIAGLSLSL
jgi:hypothetical protein